MIVPGVPVTVPGDGSQGIPHMAAGGHSMIRLIELDDFVRVMIEVDEEETDAGLRRLIPLALRWRDHVVRVQGPWMAGGRSRFLALLDVDQRGGTSYQQLANRLNRNLEALALEFLASERKTRARHRFEERVPADADVQFWPNPFAKVHAVGLLTDLGYAENDATRYVEDVLKRLRDGRRAFPGGHGPITRQRVIDVLRAWRRRHDTPVYRQRFHLKALAKRPQQRAGVKRTQPRR